MRLELSRRTDIALRALRRLDAAGDRTKRTDLAEAVGTTPDFLARIMGPLVRAGWVSSEPGRSGGYETAGDIASVSLLDLIEQMEGTPDDGTCVLEGGPCAATERCALHDPWTRAREALLAELAGTPIVNPDRRRG
jgi:Rrf2 family protein